MGKQSNKTEPGSLVREIRNAHALQVACLELNPWNKFQVFSASLDGTVKLWDYEDGVLLKTWNVGVPLSFMKASNVESEIYLQSAAKDGVSRFYRYSLAKHSLAKLSKARRVSRFSLSKCGKWMAFASKRCLFVIDLDNSNKGEGIYTHQHDHLVTSLQIDPSSQFVLFGDAKGRIYQYNFHSKSSPTNRRHWHAHGVSALAVGQEGTFFLSGGEESVLVYWHLNSPSQQFLPRIGGAAICSIGISSDETKYFVATANNAVTIIDAVSFKIACVIQGLTFSQKGLEEEHCPVFSVVPSHFKNIRQGKDMLVINGVPGHLQYFDLEADLLARDVEIVKQNLISRTDDEALIFFQVQLFASCDPWILTVERRTSHENRLKLWEISNNGLVLNTVVSEPHGQDVLGAALGRDIAVTCGTDGTFKIWGLCRDEKVFWRCLRTISYMKLRPTCCSISQDGSTIAVGYSRYITLWTKEGAIIHVLTIDSSQELTGVRFLGESPFLVSCTSDQFSLWNLVTLRNEWSYCNIEVSGVAAFNDKFGVIVAEKERQELLVFECNNRQPSAVYSHSDGVKSFCFDSHGRVVMLTKRNRVVHYGVTDQPSVESIDSNKNEADLSVFGVPKVQAYAPASNVQVAVGTKFFAHVPTSVLPGPSVIFDKFVESFLSPRTNEFHLPLKEAIDVKMGSVFLQPTIDLDDILSRLEIK